VVVHKIGKRTGYTTGTVTRLYTHSAKFDSQEIPISKYFPVEYQILVDDEDFADEGDSGALVVAEQDNGLIPYGIIRGFINENGINKTVCTELGSFFQNHTEFLYFYGFSGRLCMANYEEYIREIISYMEGKMFDESNVNQVHEIIATS